MSLIEQIVEIKKQHDSKLEEIKTAGVGDLLDEHFKKFFDDNHFVLQIKWTQELPYFNDGSPCVFEIQEFGMLIDPIFLQHCSRYEKCYFDSGVIRMPHDYMHINTYEKMLFDAYKFVETEFERIPLSVFELLGKESDTIVVMSRDLNLKIHKFEEED